MNGKKGSETIKLKHGEDFYSRISMKRKVYSGGKSFADVAVAREAQKRSVAARLRNKQLKEAEDGY